MVKSSRAVRPGAPPLPRPVSLQLAVALGLLIGAVALSTYLLLAKEPARAGSDVETHVLGQPVTLRDDAHATAVQCARSWLRGEITLVEARESATADAQPARRFTRARAALGVQVDLDALTALLQDARDAGSPLRRLHAQERGGAPLALPLPAHLEGDAAHDWLASLADTLAEPARPLRVDLRTGAIQPARPGRTLDVEATLDAIEDAVFTGAGTVTAKFVARRAPDAGSLPADPILLTSLLGRAESPLARDGRAHQASTEALLHDLRVAARTLDGTLILTGQRFDARALLSEAIAAQRVRPGPVVVGLPDPIDAAFAQVMRTVHAALLDADIAVLEEPFASSTTPGARANLRLESGLTRPFAIGVALKDGRLRAEIHGAPSDVPAH